MTLKVIVTDRVRVPKALISARDIKDRYVIELYRDSKCNKCSNLPDRSPDNELCQECPNFHGVHRFFNSKEAKQGIWSLPQADAPSIRRHLRNSGKKYKWVDRRKEYAMSTKIRFTGTLYTKGDVDDFGNPRADQQMVVEKWMKQKNGKIVARARSGKTIIATNIYCQLGVKTVVIAGKKALLNQFYESACGVPSPSYSRGKFIPSPHKAQRPAVTNIPRKQDRTGKQIIFMPKSYKQLTDFLAKEIPDVLLITYQSFIKDARRVAEVINKYYSLAIIDEEHRAGADAYLRFVASINVLYRLGLTATPDRKDGRSKLTRLVFGPVVAQTAVSTLKPQIEFYAVQAKPKTDYSTWNGAKKWIKINPERNNEIAKLAFKDMRDGYDVIVIPVEHKDHLEYLVNLINNQAKVNYKKRGENWPQPLARPYYRGVDEVETLSWVDSRDKREAVHKKLPTKSPRVLVAIMSMIKEGVDMKRPSMLYSVIPASAEYGVGAPQMEQLATRVATPYPKLQPIVRVFVDNINMFASCASSLLFNEFLPKSQLKMRHEAVYLLKNYGQSKDLITKRTAKQSYISGTGGWW